MGWSTDEARERSGFEHSLTRRRRGNVRMDWLEGRQVGSLPFSSLPSTWQSKRVAIVVPSPQACFGFAFFFVFFFAFFFAFFCWFPFCVWHKIQSPTLYSAFNQRILIRLRSARFVQAERFRCGRSVFQRWGCRVSRVGASLFARTGQMERGQKRGRRAYQRKKNIPQGSRPYHPGYRKASFQVTPP